MDDASRRLSAIQRIRETLDPALRARDQWVCWRFTDRNGKQTKVPVNARSGALADSTDRTTWSSFDDAAGTYTRASDLDGIGFVFADDDPYCGVDLDDCIDSSTRVIKPWAQAFIDLLGTYGEISPSNQGVKLLVEGNKPGPRCKTAYEDGEVEMYDHDRFFTITGNHLTGTPRTIQPGQTAIEEIYTNVFGPPAPKKPIPPPPSMEELDRPPAPSLSDDQVLEVAKRSRKNGDKIASLLSGNWESLFRSQSEADSSLIFHLAFYTKDASQLDRIFRGSKLMRDKWDEQHGEKTYGQMTIDKALSEVTEQYRPRRPVSTKTMSSPAADEEDVGAQDVEQMIPLGQREPQTGRLVLSTKRTLPTAEAFLKDFYHRGEIRTLHTYGGVPMAWRGNRYVEIEDGALRQQLLPWLHDALRYQLNKRTGESELVDFDANPASVNAALDSVRAVTHLPASLTPTCWLDDRAGAPQAKNLLPYPSGTLDLETGKTIPPTPALFNINAIDFEYDPDPEPPERWIRFLEQLFGDDLESSELLQEWMGYCLVADTSQQKMLLVVGPKRSGKGTLARVLTRLVGAGNVVGPTTSSLAGSFGLQPLLGKSLAIVSDARFSGEHVATVVERLLCISGEDTITVDRKFLPSVTMKLATRMMFLTNELPRMQDASGALAGRFVILRLTNSFYGKEDTTLTEKLLEELPGILLWAIEGLKRLRKRGHFLQPQAVQDAMQELEDLASPVKAFVRECCDIGPGKRAWTDELYAAWKAWCERDGRTNIPNRQIFGRDLAAAFPVACRRHSIQGRFYDGIALRNGGAQ